MITRSDDEATTGDVDTSMPQCRGVDIQDLSIAQLQKLMTDGTFSARDLAECYLERIRRVNPVLNAIIEVNPDALSIADKCDAERKSGKIRGPLHGIPFVCKDNICTNDKMQTTAGSKVLIGTKVAADALVITKLRRGGAVLLGHSNLSEWACMRSSYYSEGYSSRGGQCRNPHNLAEHPGGSSCGSAVAVSVSMCAFAIGTETDGSVTYPADRNGVVGLKPSLGITVCQGVIPESSSLDVVGTFGKTVEDAATALSAIAGADEKNPLDTPYESFVSDKSALKGARFAMPWKRVWEAASEKEYPYNIFMKTIDRIREAGAEVYEHVDFPSAEDIISPGKWDWNYPDDPAKSELTVVKVDFYNDLKDYLASLAENPLGLKGVEDIIEFNKRHPKEEGAWPELHGAWPTGQDTFHHVAETRGKKDETYKSALAYIRQKSREEGIDAVLNAKGEPLDGILIPIQVDSGVANQVAAKAGYPVITVPIAENKDGKSTSPRSSHVPFGLAIMQTHGKENLLIKYGSAVEDLIQGRSPARFLNIAADNYMYVGVPPKED